MLLALFEDIHVGLTGGQIGVSLETLGEGISFIDTFLFLHLLLLLGLFLLLGMASAAHHGTDGLVGHFGTGSESHSGHHGAHQPGHHAPLGRGLHRGLGWGGAGRRGLSTGCA